MGNSVYKINKGINKPIEFKGLKAQYIWWLGIGIVGLLIVFAVLYILGVNPYACVVLILGAGTGHCFWIATLSRTYGEFGLMKKLARKKVPTVLKCSSYQLFTRLQKA